MVNIDLWEEKILNELHHKTFTDGSHDIDHFKRVAHRALLFNEKEQLNGNPLVIIVAGLLHDLVEVPKDSPLRSQASRMSADAALELLQSMNFPSEFLPEIHHAILAHSYTAQVEPVTPEAKCIQDADRVEALGALGIIRCFYTAGRMETGLIHWEDPLAKNRPLDDRLWALDHFEVKLFRIPEMMQTRSGKELAESRRSFMKKYREKMIDDQSPEYDFAQQCVEEGRASKMENHKGQSMVNWVLNCLYTQELSYFVEQFKSELMV